MRLAGRIGVNDTKPTVPQYAVEHRPIGTKKWAVVAVCSSKALAWDAAYELMDRSEGDWRVSKREDSVRGSLRPVFRA